MHLTTIFDRQTTAVGMKKIVVQQWNAKTHNHTYTPHILTRAHKHCEKITHTFIFRAKRVRAAKTALSKTK